MEIEKRLRDFLHLKRTKLKDMYVWYCTNELYIQLYVCLPLLYISYIKCNVVTLNERVLTCFIIYRNAILTFLTLFVKYVFFFKNFKFYVEKIMKIEKRLRDCKNVLADDKTKCEIDGGGRGVGASC
jgi:hypothetical protein